MDRDLVIRVFRSEVADSPGFVRSFEATAQRIAALHHPAIVPIHDYWREPGAAYLVMRRMHGGSLADRLERHDRGPLTVEEVTFIVRRVGAALVALAGAGLGHGRVDARSVLFDDAGEARLGDADLSGSTLGGSRTADDVRGLAVLVGTCLQDPPAAVADVVERGRGPHSPPIDQFVRELVAALAGREPEHPALASNPYKGLRAFDEADAADFFGRSDLVDEVLARLGRDDLPGRLVLVVGGSGTGKSSVVRAGLLPRVRAGDVPGSEGWFITTMLPGAEPFKELAAALRRVAVVESAGVHEELAAAGGIDAVIRRLLPADGQLLLVVDQMEELFTSASERDQRRFLGGLVEALTVADSRLRVVGTLRADFYDRPLGVQPFGALVYDATVTIPAMSAAELEAAIVEPADRVGCRVDLGLVAELVNAAVDQPAGLPALQFTLFELAERSGGDLSLAAYQELGGLSGAIASRAEALYLSLEDEQRAAVRRLFQQLVVVHPDGEPTRRRAGRAELTAGDPALEALVDRWAEARLLSLDRDRHSRLPTVEPAHEALLREWPRLRRWIDEDRGALLVLAQLREAAASWVEVGRDPSALYRGMRLQVVLDHLGDTPVGTLEREFLDASTAAHDMHSRLALLRIERQARTNRRLRRQLVVIGVALVVALVGGFVAVDQRRDAQSGRRIAFARELAAAADANVDADPERSILLALAAIDETRHGDSALPEAIGALHEAISRSRILLSVPDVGGSADWSPDGSLFVTEGPEESGVVDLRDASTGESVRSWKGHDVDINEVAFSGDGTLLATGGDDGTLRIWDVSTGDEVTSFAPRGGESVWAPSFSDDGTLVAASWLDQEVVRVYDLRSGSMTAEIARAGVMGTDFSPDGRQLVLASIQEPGVLVVDPHSGAELRRLGEDTDTSRDARFSPDGRRLASTHADGAIRVWRADDGVLQFTVTAHPSAANTVAWSADSARLASGGDDGTGKVFDLVPGGAREVAVVSARDTGNGIASVALSADGQRLLTSDWAIAAVRIWDVGESAGAEWAALPGVAFSRGSGTFVDDGRRVLAVDPAGGVTRWDLESGERVQHFDTGEETGAPVRIAASPDRTTLATGLEHGVRLWDLQTGARLADVADTTEEVIDLAWSPDSSHLAISWVEGDHSIVTVVERDGSTAARFGEDRDTYVRDLAFAGDGTRLVLSRALPRQAPGQVGLRVWDWRQDEITAEMVTLSNDVSVDIRGNRVVSAREITGTAEIFDLDSGELVRTLRVAGLAYGSAFSVDGSRVAVLSADATVRVFDADSGRLELILRGHDQALSFATFSPDGRRLATLDEGGALRVWALDLDDLVGIARQRLTRGLDDDECRQYLGREHCASA